MKNSEYWKERFKLLEQSQNQRGIQCCADIERQYRQAQKQIEGQIATWYQRFADNNSVTIQEARRMLTSKELEELKWDINQYIRYGKENAVNGNWVKQLENASARYHISRLEALKLQTQQSIEVMFGNQLDSIDSAMRDIYKSGYYRTAFEIHKGIGVGWDFATLDDKTISKVINKPWAVDGKNFSERIWSNRQKLVNELNQTLTQNIILGQDPQKAIDTIARKMNTSKAAAGRLVMTEEAFFSSAAQKDCFNELDVEQFEIVATLDSHTSEICQEMDGKVFPMSQWEVGVTAPPFHVLCRSTTVPAFGDEFDNIGQRVARGGDGKTYYVPADMTYKQWEQYFVQGGDKSDLKEIGLDDTIKPKEHSESFKSIMERIEKDHVDFNEVQPLKEKLSDEKIIDRLGGGDLTRGSCSSLAFAYVGNKSGMDVLDFRGGNSQYHFSTMFTIQDVTKLNGVKSIIVEDFNAIKGATKLLGEIEDNKEYYLAVGQHAAIVKRDVEGLKYLELQSAYSNGFKPLTITALQNRFGAKKSRSVYGNKLLQKIVLIDIESLYNNDEFIELLGYINTVASSQQKGVNGHVK